MLAGIDKRNLADLSTRARRARELVYGSPLPEALRHEVEEAYGRLVDE